MAGRNPRRLFFAAAVVLIAAVAGVLLWMEFKPLYAYLAAANGVALVFYGYDKRQSIVGKRRIPEVVLHLLALGGGTLGALLGQMAFRHKTRKVSFRIVFVVIVVLQIAAIVFLLKHQG
jgi:uncharacterized membrane protein YsdA (DUF1294 family)